MAKIFKKNSTLTKSSIEWTFLSNYAHVLICLHKNPDILLREVAVQVGITERAVQAIVRNLAESKILEKVKSGRRNRYTINRDQKLRHPLESHHSINELLQLAK
jgi:predicted transcriptional regulator